MPGVSAQKGKGSGSGCCGSAAKAQGEGQGASVGARESSGTDVPREPYVTGTVEVNGKRLPVVSATLTRRDILGGWKARWLIGRMRYTVRPGLYAVGSPAPESPVLVTANYKLSFDALRRELSGIDAWIMVLDTRGINVWCAAGKGTFGTRELERRVMAARLDQVVSHRTLILPQLGAPGVSAPEVKEATGFRVKWGPVRARDLRVYLGNGLKKDTAMRRVRFAFTDRMAIAPAELVQSWPVLAGIFAASALFGLPLDGGWAGRLASLFLPLCGAVLMGTLAFPALLPVLPFKAFSVKGAILGAAWAVISALVLRASPAAAGAYVLLVTPITAFIAMNFTGSSTFTCQPGAVLEVKRGMIPMIASLVLGAGLAAAVRVFSL
jgi:hypothetical protein